MPAPAQGSLTRRPAGPRWPSCAVTAAGILIVTGAFAALGWQRRWISDDGLIVVRTVRNILAGNGPVFNAVERAEANTSTLWTWVLAAVGSVTPGDLAYVTVIAGLVCAVAAVLIALDASRRLHRSRGSTSPLVPAGILVVLAVPPFWDFATSGLETGLALLWLAGAWWLLGWLPSTRPLPKQALAWVVLGLGPLVRPDFALVSAVFVATAWLLTRPRRRRTFALLVAAGAVPIGYQLFRAGYYGTLVPLPALAKSASHAEWLRGVRYVTDLVQPYCVIVPAGLLAAIGLLACRRAKLDARTQLLVAAPLLAAALLTLFIMRVGGDFMHGRMMLPSTFLAILPVAMVPARRFTAPLLAALTGWAIFTAVVRGDGKNHTVSPGINDERLGYTLFVGSAHPVRSEQYVHAAEVVGELARSLATQRRRQLLTEGGIVAPIAPAFPASLVFIAGRLGLGGVVTPLEGFVIDTLGLANPVGARITMTNAREAPGHQKSLPGAWIVADVGDPIDDERNAILGGSPAAIRAARHALRCAPLADLLDSVRQPMSWDRFWANVAGALARTRLVIPHNPFAAERAFCAAPLLANLALGATITASSAYRSSGWSPESCIDGEPRSAPGLLGYSSALGVDRDHPEWIELQLPAPTTFANVVLHPRDDAGMEGQGFPRDLAIQLWLDGRWVERVSRSDLPSPGAAPQTYGWTPPDTTTRVRIEAGRLRQVGADFLLQLAEIELLP